MKNTTHTPGPWRVEPTQWNHGETTTIGAGDGFSVAEIHSPAWDEKARLKKEAKQDRANARLIAKAPEMASALRAAYAAIDDKYAPNTVALIRALLASIDGTPEVKEKK